MTSTRINLANPQELLELPGATELTQILGPQIVTPTLLAHVDFQPAEATAAEAPGA